VRVFAGNVYARVVDATRAERDLAWRYLSAEVPGARRTTAFKAGRWDGMEHFLSDDQFPTGFLRPLGAELRRHGMELDVDDRRAGVFRAPYVEREAQWLMGHQVRALEAFLPRTRGVIESPTGSGKSEVAVALAQVVRAPVLALVDTRDLMHNLADRFELRTKEKAGRCGDGSWDVRRFTVATFQGISLDDDRGRDLTQRARVLVVDEVQVLPADHNFKVAMACTNAYYRLGISATPTGRMDGRDHRVVAAIGPLVHRIPRADLVDAGLVADGEVRFVRFDHPKATGNFAEVYEAEVVLSEARNRLVVELARRAPRPTLVFVKIEQHGQRLRRLLQESKLRADFVSGKTQTGGRRAAITALEHGNLDVLVCGKIFNKGVDIPSLRGMVNAAGGRSAHDAIQRAGRGGRAIAGKAGFVFYDVDDRKNRWLAKHALERKTAYRDAGFSVRVVEDVAQLDLVAA
jgi:superfamily II DNA or RNA helicase